MSVTADNLATVNKLAIGAIALPPGSMFQQFFLDAMAMGFTEMDVAQTLMSSASVQMTMPDSDSNEVFITKFVQQLAGGYGTAENISWINNHLLDMLNNGASRAEMLVNMIHELDTASSADGTWGEVADLFHNRVLLSIIYSGNSAHATDVEGMHFAMELITPDYSSVAAAAATIDKAFPTVSVVGSPTMTEGGDIIYTVSRIGDLSVTSTVDFTISTGNGAGVSDYGAPSDAVNGIMLNGTKTGGTLVFPKFVSVASFVVPALKDGIADSGESLTVTIANNPNDTISLINEKQSSATTTLYDLDKKMVLKGDTGSNLLIGGNNNDTLTGSAGNDTLVGGDGKDKLVGGSGQDIFQYNVLSQGGDIITDFKTGDKLVLSHDAFSGSVGQLPVGQLTADHFLTGANEVSSQNTNQFFMYDTTTHNLYYDADAGGGLSFSVLLATFSNNAVITEKDIWLS